MFDVPQWWAGFHLYEAMEIAGVFFAALAGGLAGVRKRFDIFGVLVLAWAAGLGGGVIRDVLIGRTPPVGVSHLPFLAAALLAGVLINFVHPSVARMRRTVVVLDALALGLFVMLGTVIALNFGAGSVASVVVGMLTGIGGGMLRDLLVGEVPLVLVDRQLYAIPALGGAIVTALLWANGWLSWWMQAIVVSAVVGIRLISLRRGWTVPSAGAMWNGRWGIRGKMEE
ncbi:MAG: trimeric intracellular cation channel family protein [Promicromonosporaceae bacterium]|nr:trimeric intracellular cation channel family protein [Promicromonosporaceae bacterium]